MPDPVFMMALYNERIRTGKLKLHDWQQEVLFRYARKDIDYTTQINRMNLVAANGSGKSQMVVAPAACWTSMAYESSRVVITSSSGKQLDGQTGRAVRHVCEQVNALSPGYKPWDIKYREYTYRPNPEKPHIYSTIEMFATDEPGKAEGYHPHVDNGIFAYIPDEAKSINDSIWQAIERCNGKSHWLNVSSPGQPQGKFYEFATSPRWWTRKVTAYECPHIKKEEIEGAKEAYGEHSAFFRSAYLAEFTSVNESVVIRFEHINRQYMAPPDWQDDGIMRAGVDLSGGGDENVVSVWRGNKQVGMEIFRVEDTRVTVSLLVSIFKKYNLSQENINIDDGYIGRAIIHSLRDHKYFVNAVNFGAKAYNNVAYGNRGTELWFNFERHLPHLILLNDPVLRKQLPSRYYKISDTSGKIILESKREAKANGHNSPDRADATVLAFSGVPLGYFNSGSIKLAKEKTPGTLEYGLEAIRLLIENKGNIHNFSEEHLMAAMDTYRHLCEQRDSALSNRNNRRLSNFDSMAYLEESNGNVVSDNSRMVCADNVVEEDGEGIGNK